MQAAGASGASIRIGAGDTEMRALQKQQQSETSHTSKLVIMKSRVKGFLVFF